MSNERLRTFRDNLRHPYRMAPPEGERLKTGYESSGMFLLVKLLMTH